MRKVKSSYFGVLSLSISHELEPIHDCLPLLLKKYRQTASTQPVGTLTMACLNAADGGNKLALRWSSCAVKMMRILLLSSRLMNNKSTNGPGRGTKSTSIIDETTKLGMCDVLPLGEGERNARRQVLGMGRLMMWT